MSPEEFINMLKLVIIRFDESGPGSCVQREIIMWRTKLITNYSYVLLGEDIHKIRYITDVFLSLPSYDLLVKDPLEIIQEIVLTYSKDNK